jgi:predicted dehydrogenase
MAITMGAYIDGGGHVGGHMKDVALHEGIERVLLTGSEQAQSLATDMEKATFVEDWETVLEEVPAALVLTNNRDAGRVTLEAVEAGVWVYAEKPGARTADEMQSIVSACARTGAHFTPCYTRRTYPETLEIKRLLEAGVVGELWSFQANWITSQAALRGTDTWFFSEEMAGGGILYWLGCHWIDLIRYVTGERIVAVSAMCRTAEERIDVEDVACLSVRLEGGAIGTIRCGFVLDPFDGYDDYHLMTAWEGSRGAISHFPRGPVTVRTRSRGLTSIGGSDVRELAIDTTRPGAYALELLDDFLAALAQERRPLVAEDDALYVMRVAEAAYRASATGSEQQL